MTRTEGRRLLTQYLAKEGNSQVRLAALVGVNQSSVHDWCYGVSRPESHMRTALESLCAIPVDAWLTAKERRALARALRAGAAA